MSGADLANLCNEAALIAAQRGRDQVTMSDFTESQDKVVLGKARSLLMNEPERRVIAYHESGHALVAWFLPAADPVQKVTIYDVAGNLWKTELFEEETIDGVPTPIRIVMKDLHGKSSTEIRVSDVRYDVEVPDALFDPMKLPTAVSSPVRQDSSAQITKTKNKLAPFHKHKYLCCEWRYPHGNDKTLSGQCERGNTYFLFRP